MLRTVGLSATCAVFKLCLVLSVTYALGLQSSSPSAAAAVPPTATVPASSKALPRTLLQASISGSSTNGNGSSSSGAAATIQSSNTVIVIRPNVQGTDGSNSTGGTIVQVLNCPGDPDFPDSNVTDTDSKPQTNTVITNSPSPSTGSGTASDTQPSENNRTPGPVKPENPRIEELPPAGLDLSKLRGPDTVVATMLLQGIDAQTFVSDYSSTVDNITATLTGTPVNVWNITVQDQPQQGNRRLLQQQQQTVDVTLSLYATNPLIVWYRLTKVLSKSATASGSISSSQTFSGCITDYCSLLVSAGVPVDSSSIQISPDYDRILGPPAPADATATGATASGGTTSGTASVTETTDPVKAVAENPVLQGVQSKTDQLNTIRRAIGSVFTALIGIGLIWLCWWKRENIKRNVGKCFGCKTGSDADKLLSGGQSTSTDSKAAAPTAAEAVNKDPAHVSSDSDSKKVSSSGTKRSGKKRGGQSRRRPRGQGGRSASDFESQTDVDNADVDSSSVDRPLTPSRPRYASFEKRKYKAAAAAAAQSPIASKISGQFIASDASASSLGSSAAVGSNGSVASKPDRRFTPPRRNSDDGNNSEAGTIITIRSFINADATEEKQDQLQQRMQQQQQQQQQQQTNSGARELDAAEQKAIEDYLARSQKIVQKPEMQ